jgi:hypothetical protein
MAEQVAVHALNVCGVEDHPYGYVTGRASDLAAGRQSEFEKGPKRKSELNRLGRVANQGPARPQSRARR